VKPATVEPGITKTATSNVDPAKLTESSKAAAREQKESDLKPKMEQRP